MSRTSTTASTPPFSPISLSRRSVQYKKQQQCYTTVFLSPQVCPPGLHITLGIFLRLFVLLETECHKLDLAMHVQGSDSGPSYDKYAAVLEQQTELKDEQHSLKDGLKLQEQLLTHFLTSARPSAGVLTTTNPHLLNLFTEIQNTKGKIKNLVSRYYAHQTLSVPKYSHALTANRDRQTGECPKRRLSQGGRGFCQGIRQRSGFFPCTTPSILLWNICG